MSQVINCKLVLLGLFGFVSTSVITSQPGHAVDRVPSAENLTTRSSDDVDLEEVLLEEHPLTPPDMSSPYATLHSFYERGNLVVSHLHGEHWTDPTPESAAHLFKLIEPIQQMLDLSDLPPAARWELSRDAMLQLTEVLARLDPAGQENAPGAHEGDELPASWTIPNTEITLTKVEEGSKKGQYVFSADTVARASEFFEEIKDYPYQRELKLNDWDWMDSRHYYAATGWLFPSEKIDSLPDWLKQPVFGQGLWKLLIILVFLCFWFFIFALLYRLLQSDSETTGLLKYLRRILIPLCILFMSLALSFLNKQVALIGGLGSGLSLFAEVAYYFALALLMFPLLMIFAELIIASPKLSPQGFNAHLVRLAARSMAIAIALVIIFDMSAQIGLPLYGVLAGLGVGGLAVALAAQHSLENYLAGINLLSDHPVQVGDWCVYEGSDWANIGMIQAIGMRSTTIRNRDYSLTSIPNAQLAKMNITNLSAQKKFLFATKVRLRLETTSSQLRQIHVRIREMLLRHPMVLDEKPRVRFSAIAEDAFELELRCKIDTSDYEEYRIVSEDILFRVMDLVDESGLQFAYPATRIYRSDDVELDADLQRVAEEQVDQWRREKRLPFPQFPKDRKEEIFNTGDYPPEGAPTEEEE